MRSTPPPAIDPFMVMTREASSGNPTAVVSVAPVFTVRSRHEAVATPDVDGALRVPAGMIASVPAFGTPADQFPAADQLELTAPVQVVWPCAIPECASS